MPTRNNQNFDLKNALKAFTEAKKVTKIRFSTLGVKIISAAGDRQRKTTAIPYFRCSANVSCFIHRWFGQIFNKIKSKFMLGLLHSSSPPVKQAAHPYKNQDEYHFQGSLTDPLW